MSGISSSSSSSSSDFLLDESGSWTLLSDDGGESNINVLYSILGAMGFFICLYSIRFWCDKKQANL